MAFTIAIKGKGIIANADATPDTAMSGSLWNEVGGGSESFTTDTFLFGDTCFAGAYSSKSGYQYYDIGSANTLDFISSAGPEVGQNIYMWIHCPTIGLLESIANKGLAIRIGSDLINHYREFIIAGHDDANGWNGGWKCFVIDPTKPGSVNDTGTFDLAAVRYFGVWIETTDTARGDNIFISQIAVGFGLQVDGEEQADGWKTIVDYCTDYPNRAWGVLQERDGIYYVLGKLTIGTTGQYTFFRSTDKVIQFATSQYYESGAWKTSFDVDASGIDLVDGSSNRTEFIDGVVVGSDQGRSGCVYIGSDDQDVQMSLDASLASTHSSVDCYGTSFKNIRGGIVINDDGYNSLYSCSFSGCGQLDVSADTKVYNCSFISTAGPDAALLWNENIVIADCNFIANEEDSSGVKAGIEHPSAVGSPYEYDHLVFSGNDNDVYNTSGSAITVENINLADAGSYSTDGDVVNFETPSTLAVHVEDKDGNDIEHVQVYLHRTNPSVYTTAANSEGAAALIVNEVVDTYLPQTGWCIIWDRSLNETIPIRYASWTSKTFTLRAEVSGTAAAGGSGTTLKGTGFLAADIEEGDAVRNTTDSSWAVVDEIVDDNTITTFPLQGGGDDTWSENDGYSFHRLPVALVNGDDVVDVPFMNKQTDGTGDATKNYNGGTTNIDVRIRSNHGSTKYLPYTTSGLIDGGYSLTAILQEDEVAT